MFYVATSQGRCQLYYHGYLFNRNNCTENRTYWRCAQNGRLNCGARIVGTSSGLTVTKPIHNHEPFTSLEKTRHFASVTGLKNNLS